MIDISLLRTAHGSVAAHGGVAAHGVALLAGAVMIVCAGVARPEAAAGPPAATPAASIAVAAPAPGAPEPAPAAAGTLDEVLVTGERPGPGMWRVSRGGHELWILATLEPLPKKMVWRSATVEARIAASQIVIAPPQVTTDVGFFRGLTLLPALLRARKNPDGQTLEQALPHDLYIRWLALRVKYLGNGSGDEQTRPMLAALDLYLHALDASGLTSDDGVWDVVEKTAHRQHVPILPVTLKLSIDDPRDSIRQFGRIPEEAKVACLEKTMERLETDLQPMRQRANMWSLGDVPGLKAQGYPDERIACLDAFFTVPQLRDQLQRAKAQIDAAWRAAAEGALAKNDSSFAVLPIVELLEPGGWLDQLRAGGYEVKEP